jgi:addiction module HigA family antidote
MASEVKTEFRPDYASHPGETLLETIEAKGMKQAELARRMGRNKVELSRIIAGRSGISSETALQLERALGVAASFWIALQCQYDESVARRIDRERLAAEVDWVRKFPYRSMARLGWLADTSDRVERVRALLDFFGIASAKQWSRLWQRPEVRFRMSQALEPDFFALSAWLRKGELMGAETTCAPFDESAFRVALHKIRPLTREPPEVFVPELQRLCSSTGVAAVFVPELPRIRASGATRWLSPTKALVQLSLRYRRDDQLWFSFFHECGHVLLHGKRDTFIENSDRGQGRPEETEANRFAAEHLIPSRQYDEFVRLRSFAPISIRSFARRIRIAPGIIVGRLQHDKHVPFSHANNLKVPLQWSAS